MPAIHPAVTPRVTVRATFAIVVGSMIFAASAIVNLSPARRARCYAGWQVPCQLEAVAQARVFSRLPASSTLDRPYRAVGYLLRRSASCRDGCVARTGHCAWPYCRPTVAQDTLTATRPWAIATD